MPKYQLRNTIKKRQDKISPLYPSNSTVVDAKEYNITEA